MPAAGAQAFLYKHGTLEEIAVYAQETGSQTLLQPLTSNAEGLFPGWIEGGQTIDIVVNQGAVSSPTRTIEAVKGSVAGKAAKLGTDGTVGGPEGSPLSPSVATASSVLRPSGDESGATDQAALIAALEAGGLIISTPGTYYWTGSIMLNLANPVTWLNYGATWICSQSVATNQPQMSLAGNDIQLLGGVFNSTTVVEDPTTINARQANAATLRFGALTGHPTGGIYTRLLVRDLKVLNSPNTPIYVSGVWNVRILDNVLGDEKNNIWAGSGNGIYTTDCPGALLIRGNQLYGMGDDGIYAGADSNAGITSSKLAIVVDNAIHKSYGAGIDINGVDGGTVDRNVIDNTYSAGILVTNSDGGSGSTRLHVGAANVIKNPGQFFGPGQYKIAAQGTTGYGVYVNDSSNDVTIDTPLVYNPNLGGAVRVNVTGTGVIRRGRPPGQRLTTGQYLSTRNIAFGKAALANGNLFCCPIWVPDPLTALSLSVNVTKAGSAGALIRLGIYTDSGNFYPGALLLDAGTVAATALGIKTAAIELKLVPGLYWLAAASQGEAAEQPEVACLQGQAEPLPTNGPTFATINGFYESGITGILPAAGPTGLLTSTAVAIRLGF